MQKLINTKIRLWQVTAIATLAVLLIFLVIRASLVIDYRWIFGASIFACAFVYALYHQAKPKMNLDLQILGEIRDAWMDISSKTLDISKPLKHPLTVAGTELLYYFPQDQLTFWYELGKGIKGIYKDSMSAVAHDIETSKLAQRIVEQGGQRELTKEQLEKLGYQIP